ncbi:hypothetical protein SCATT_p14480 (plasmid) [Streptantibioticus cattleyicolor NRRL 8057 = DSM 46488]|uniref:Uncharacterized protein n=1 Tax=Streptantibioticus cattleyicolor (strain ATCC 35852 / DSM 46488 / JCM 4925 / NBRC 14057 / NRRL 8057) TaxID=1003195 RepID=G8XGJ3_STREN|nr:hypothetical protein SCATT_p14480 [Streptantibioticus cattleyicolor NRRL 8057 = DSM 46488]
MRRAAPAPCSRTGRIPSRTAGDAGTPTRTADRSIGRTGGVAVRLVVSATDLLVHRLVAVPDPVDISRLEDEPIATRRPRRGEASRAEDGGRPTHAE